MKPKIIYVFDAVCSWCYGFSPVIQAIHDNYQQVFEFEVLSGGMIPPEKSGSAAKTAGYLNDAYKNVEDVTGVSFGQAFLHNLEKGEMIFSSETPAIALSVFKNIEPKKTIEFARRIQESIFFDGKSSDDIDLYRYLAVNFSIDPDKFERKMNDEQFKEAARYDFALAKQLKVTSYPAAFIQQSETKFYLIAQGYANYETIELRINNIKKEIGL